MSRYINHFTVCGGVEYVNGFVNQFLLGQGFRFKKYQGEDLYQKGQGIAVGPKFVKISFEGELMQLEAWVKFSIVPGVYSGEMDLTGTAGMATKKPLRTIIDNLEAQLMQLGCQPVVAQPWQSTPAATVAPPPVQKPTQSYAPPKQPAQQRPQPAQQRPQPAQQRPQPAQQTHTPPTQPAQSYAPPAGNTTKYANNGKCLRCGAPLLPYAVFCSQCGLKRN